MMMQHCITLADPKFKNDATLHYPIADPNYVKSKDDATLQLSKKSIL